MSIPTVTLSANTSWYLFNFRRSTILRLQSEGYRVVCLSPQDDYSARLEAELGCQWLPLTMDNKGSNPLRDAFLFRQFIRCYKKLRPIAAFHFTIKNNIYGTWAARLLNIPAINNVSGLGTAFIRSGVVAAIVRMLYKTSQPLAHRVFCQNEEDYQLLVEQKLVPVSRLQLLPGSGVDLQRFHPGLRQSHGDSFRFLYAGRMLADKGLYELIEAFTTLYLSRQDCALWLCGFTDADNVSAISESRLQAWAKLPGVTWLGASDNMEHIYAQVDAVVLPSYREGMPRSLLEAGAMGLPVVTTNVPGCRNLVAHGDNGLLCEPKNSQSLQLAMAALLNMPENDRKRLGDNSRHLIERAYSEDLVVDAAIKALPNTVA
ncbi:MAG: glycosyltransferase family 4 protein [Porticoccaceae bacterium]|nr:glycosyltransferase family 4 protein [Porticoccaceae bacterium]